MEDKTPYDLDQALRQWRAKLQDLGGLRADELEELEGHLRESISVLHTRGLSVQEAFEIATRRLGSERQLSDEFAKANPQRAWTERSMWMVAGVLAALALSAVAAPLSSIVLSCAIWSGLKGQMVVALHFLSALIVWAGAAAIAYRVVSRHSSWLDRSVQACIRRPVLSGLGLFIVLEYLPYGMRRLDLLAEPVYSFFTGRHVPTNPNIGVDLNGWLLWGGLLTQLLWIAAGPLLAGYTWRKRERLASGSPNSPELQPGEREAARALQGQGLSLDEAGLVLRQRRCPREGVAPSRGLADDRGIWLERAVWMVTRAALSQCLDMLVLNPAWIVAVATRPVAPLLQHLASLASVCLGLALAGAIVASIWKWITRHPRQSASVGRVCLLRPFVAAVALVVVCASIGGAEYAFFTYVVRPANGGLGPIGSQWMMHGATLTHLIIPIALLLWLARRWRSIQTDPAPRG